MPGINTHTEMDRISLLETVVIFAQEREMNFDLVYSRKIYRTLFLHRDTMFRDLLLAEKQL
jgi:hypothetical protein